VPALTSPRRTGPGLHEYTVPTPGSADRGARRIVIADHGEAFWTDDHDASFWRIAP
jgi:ribonuclease T1